MTTRILFVDDEPNILQGLRRMLRSMRKEWEMDFAEGGAQALEKLAAAPFDAVVTDMRMPGMNGAALLGEIAKLYPGTIRFILSGEAEVEATYLTVGISHQFLPKPCDSESLVERLRQCLALRDRLPTPELQAAVTVVGSLPTPPDALQPLMRPFEDDSLPPDQAAELLGNDVGMAAKLLQLANSAYFGIGQSVASPAKAASMLGLETLGTLVRDHQLIVPLAESPLGALYGETWRRSLRVAQGAQAIAQQQGLSETDVEHARVAGLLHAVGRLVLCVQLPDSYQKVVAAADAGTLEAAEQQVLGVSNAAVGAYFTRLWGLSETVVSAIAEQSSPCPENPVSMALHAATGIACGLARQESLAEISQRLDMGASNPAESLPVWIEDCSRAWAETEGRP